jgi:hypothetical protein
MSTNAAPAGWDPDALHQLLTPQRLTSYIDATAGSLADALALYDWNVVASAAVLTTTAMVEVLVRNSLDAQLVAWAARRSAREWFDVVSLDRQGRQDLRTARDRAAKRGPELHGRVVAELTFGFWRYLTASRYLTSLWVPATAAAFPLASTDLRRRREDVEKRLQRIHFVRNRAAHHEPIHRRDLGRDLTAAVELSAWISPDAASWVTERSSINAVIDAKP